MSERSYPRPPIVEAAIELRFSEKLSDESVTKVIRKFGNKYPFSDAETELTVRVDVAAQASTTSPEWIGTKLSSVDRTDLTIIRNTAFLVSRLAPYAGWAQFVTRAREDWETAMGVLGRKTIGRIGVRYINRLDIPGAFDHEIAIEDYLNITPALPELDWEPISGYVMQVNRELKRDGCAVTITTGVVPSPLVGYRALMLDIDTHTEKNIPTNQDDLWTMIDHIRLTKNKIFEGCITEKARELFLT